jgi:hypothetical protein
LRLGAADETSFQELADVRCRRCSLLAWQALSDGLGERLIEQMDEFVVDYDACGPLKVEAAALETEVG